MNQRSIKVLLVEDEQKYALLLEKRLLASSSYPFELVMVDTMQRALDRIKQDVFDVILLDLNLPDSRSDQTLEQMKGAAQSIPIVVVSGSEEHAMKALEMGVQDYLIKDQADIRFLSRVIRYAIERKRAEEKIRARTKELEQLNRLMAGRELRMAELEKKIHALKSQRK